MNTSNSILFKKDVNFEQSMNCETTIRLVDLLGTTIHTREASNQLLKLVQENPCQKIELDFLNVSYISRSFADQLYADKTRLSNDLRKYLVITNANDEVISMLQAVERTQNKSRKQYVDSPVYKYSSWKQIEDYLLSI